MNLDHSSVTETTSSVNGHQKKEHRQKECQKNGHQQMLCNLAMLATVFFWGISFISTKVVLRELPPSTIALFRFIVASLLLCVLLHMLEPGSRPKKGDFPLFALAGIFGISLYFFFENTGIKFTTAVNASLIVTFVPLITILLDIIFFHSRTTPLKIAGVSIALIGTYLSITANGQISFASTHFKGNLYMVGAMLVWAFYTLITKFLQGKYSGLTMTTFQTVFGTLFLVPLALSEFRQWKMVSLAAFGHIMFLAVCCSVVGYLFYNFALKRLDVTVTTIYLNLIPVVGVAGGFIFLGESVLPIQMLGGLITLVAIIVVNLEVISYEKSHPLPQEAESKA